VASSIIFGVSADAKRTLCGLQATRYVNVFTPAEASCRECSRRWELARAAEAAKTPEQRKAENAQQSRQAAMGCLLMLAIVIAVVVYLSVHH
jgi:hypothetical protein